MVTTLVALDAEELEVRAPVVPGIAVDVVTMLSGLVAAVPFARHVVKRVPPLGPLPLDLCRGLRPLPQWVLLSLHTSLCYARWRSVRERPMARTRATVP